MQPAKAYAAYDPQSALAPWNFERRNPGADEIQINIRYCGVCHSDLHQARNEWFPGIFPMVPGHEIVGDVIFCGDKVTKFKVGDLAGVGCMVDSCRTCENCKAGLEQYCLTGNVGTYNSRDKAGNPTYGGYSNTIVVHEDFALKVAGSLNLAAVAPLLCAGITTWSPLRHWKVGPGTKLAVLGLGGLGHMGVKFGVALGAEVTVLSTSPGKKEDALKLGAHHFVLTSDKQQTKAVVGKFDLILDTVSAVHDINSYLSLLRTDGSLVLVGIPPDALRIPPFGVIIGRKSVAGSSIGGIPETQEMLDFCAANNIVSDIELIAIQDINKAYERMVKNDVKYRFVIDMATL